MNAHTNVVEERLDEVIHPVRERLMQRLAHADRAALHLAEDRPLTAADYERVGVSVQAWTGD